MPEWAESKGGRPNLSTDEQKEISSKMMARAYGKLRNGEFTDNGTPFNNDELTFIGMCFSELESKLGWRGRRLLKKKYNPVNEVFDKWVAGKRE